MLESLIGFSLTQRLAVGLALVVTCLAGFFAWTGLPVDAFPDIAPTQVKVILKVPGMTAEEIEQSVTYPVETELLGIPRKTILRSTTKYAITDITIDFEDGVDIYWARQQVTERLAALREILPTGTTGGLAPMSTPLSEMFMFTVEHPRLDLRERRELLDWVLRPALRTVPGVADVNVLGGEVRTYQITPDPVRLREAGVQVDDLRQALERGNRNSGVGRLEQGVDALIVRLENRATDLDSLQAFVIAERDGRVVRLADVATVTPGYLTRYGAVTRNGEETAQGLVVSLRGTNTGAVVARVKERLAEVQKSLPQGTEVNVFYDRAQLIDGAVGTMSWALVQAVVLVVLLLAVFLGNLRAAAVVSLSLPVAALATFLLMSLTGVTANLMSLGGLVIAIGLLVDSSVVVVENVLARIDEGSPLPRLHIVYRGACEVARPVLVGSIVVVLVFAPLMTLQGLEGKLFAPVALTIVFAMLAALLFALAVVPLLVGLLSGKINAHPPRFVLRGQQAYAASLEVVLRHRTPALALGVLCLVISGFVASQLGRTFMPVMDEGDIIVQLEKSPSISLGASLAMDRQIELALLERVPEILQVVARTGSDELGLDPMSLNETDIFMQLVPAPSWRPGGKAALADAIREVLTDFPGMAVGFTQPIQMRVSEMLTGSTGDLTVKLFGDRLDQLGLLVDRIAEELGALEGAVDVQKSLPESDAFLNLRPRAQLAATTGAGTTDLAESLAQVFEGLPVGTIREGRKRIPILLNTDAAARPASSAGLRDHRIVTPGGEIVALGDVVEVSEEPGPVLIEREQGSRYAAVSLNVQGRDINRFVEEARERLGERVLLPPGYRLEFGGEFENQQRAMSRLLLLVPVVLLLIVALLFATFRSIPIAVLVLLNTPFALMGGVVALFVSGEYLSVPASVGLIALLGIAVLNAVVMLSYLEQERVRGGDLTQRVIAGAVQRLRPILMTATTAMFGLVPLVFASGPGAEIQRPLAIVVIGGLVTSTLTTLYLLPLFYEFYEARRA
jgi:cobalt-zinc-cadmium resistance protein CzcA